LRKAFAGSVAPGKQLFQLRVQEYFLQLKYQTPANWQYEFIINQTGTQDVSVLRPNRDDFRSSNDILFRVIYNF